MLHQRIQDLPGIMGLTGMSCCPQGFMELLSLAGSRSSTPRLPQADP